MIPTPKSSALRLGLAHAIAHWAKYRGDMPALVVDEETLTYAQLHRMAVEIEIRLMSLVQPRQRVALVIESKVAFIPALVATIRAGCAAVICQPGWSAEQFAQVVKDNQLAAVLHDGEFRTLSRASGEPIANVRLPVTAANPTAIPKTALRCVSSEWAVLFSSGTTGQPKGMVRTDQSMLNELICWCLELGLGRETQFYVGRPLFYTGGLMLTASTLLVGGTVHVPQTHDTESFVAFCGRMRPSHAFLVPGQIQQLVELAKSSEVKPLNTTILTMGSFIEPSLKIEARDALGCKIIESWGNSEGLGTITAPADVELRPNSIGRPFLCDCIVVTDEEGQQLPSNTHGRLAGIADSTLSYYESRDDLNRCLIRDGLVISEDVGCMDEAGYFYLAGRASDFVETAGATINLREIDRALCRQPGVAAACVVNVSEPSESPRIMAAVERRPATECDGGKLLDAIRQEGVSGASQVEQILVVDHLDRNAAEKVHADVVRGKLRSAFVTIGSTNHKKSHAASPSSETRQSR